MQNPAFCEEIRAKLRARGIRFSSSPGFYQLMGRVEDDGYIKGRYVIKITNGQIIRRRKYRVMPKGARSVLRSIDFYGNWCEAVK